jgi:hypothetical protein
MSEMIRARGKETKRTKIKQAGNLKNCNNSRKKERDKRTWDRNGE